MGLLTGRGNASGILFASMIGMLVMGGCRPREAGITSTSQEDMEDSATAEYMVVNLSDGPKASHFPVHYSSTPPDLNNDVCRTTEMWFRRIDPDTFTMGCPPSELGHSDNETPHQVTLTKPFYMGIFEVTQRQYMLVMGGTNPSKEKGDTRPVERVSFEMLRGSSAGSKWPADHDVDAASFFGKMREKANLMADLPTEAQWEYACRAGTTSAFNNGKNMTDTTGRCLNMTEVGRYRGNEDDGKWGYSGKHTKVGMYLPNAWGLYDMHGNVFEWCLDWHAPYGEDTATDPAGPVSGDGRILRGGDYSSWAAGCRSAYRNRSYPYNVGEAYGFRACVQP